MFAEVIGPPLGTAEVGRVVDLAKYDNRVTGDEGDNYLYAWRLTGCPVK